MARAPSDINMPSPDGRHDRNVSDDSTRETSPDVLEIPHHQPSVDRDGQMTVTPPRPRDLRTPSGRHQTHRQDVSQPHSNATEIDPSDSDVTTEQSALTAANAKIEELEAELARNITALKTFEKDVRITHTTLRTENSELLDECNTAVLERNDALKQVTELKRQLEDATVDRQRANDAFLALKDQGKASAVVTNKKIESLKDECEKLTQDAETSQHLLREEHELSETRLQEIGRLKDALADAQSERDEARVDLETSKKGVRELEEEMDLIPELQASAEYLNDLRDRLASFLDCPQEELLQLSPGELVGRLQDLVRLRQDDPPFSAASERAESPTKRYSSQSLEPIERPSDLDALDALDAASAVPDDDSVSGDGHEPITVTPPVIEPKANGTGDEEPPIVPLLPPTDKASTPPATEGPDAVKPASPDDPKMIPVPPTDKTSIPTLPEGPEAMKPTLADGPKTNATVTVPKPARFASSTICLAAIAVLLVYYFVRFQVAQSELQRWVAGNMVRTPGYSYRPVTGATRFPLLAELIGMLDSYGPAPAYRPGMMKG